MSRNRRRAVAIAGVFAIAPMVSACAAGQHPQSALPTQLAEGVNASVHQVDVRNAFLLGPVPGQHLTTGGSAPLYTWFDNHASTPDRLVAVQAPGVTQSVGISGGGLVLPPGRLVSTALPAGEVPPPATPGGTPAPSGITTPTPIRQPLGHSSKTKRTPTPTVTPAPITSVSDTPAAGSPAAGDTRTASVVILGGLTKDFVGGETVRLILHFERAGALTLDIPVMPRQGDYATYAPAPVSVPTGQPVRPATGTAGTTHTPKVGKSKKATAQT